MGTYWGSIDYEQIYFIDLDINNKVYFTGQTEGKFKRTAGCYGKDNTTQFIGRLSNDLSKEEFITTFGNRTNSVPELCPSAFMVDNCYNIYFSGWGSVIGIGNNGTTNGLPITADAHQKTTDNHDFYLIVLGKDAKSLKYASYFGGNKSRDHVDGGTSRFDNRGIIYQSVCASCPNSPPGLNDFPTSPANVVFKNNVSIRCSNASFKLDFRLGYSIDAIFTVTPKPFASNLPMPFNPYVNTTAATYGTSVMAIRPINLAQITYIKTRELTQLRLPFKIRIHAMPEPPSAKKFAFPLLQMVLVTPKSPHVNRGSTSFSTSTITTVLFGILGMVQKSKERVGLN